MAKLTDTQFIVLSKAAARDDGIASIPGGLNKAAATKVGASLVSRKLMRKVRSKPDMPVWREDEEGRGTSLVITREGREAIGLEDGENDSSNLSLGAEERDVSPSAGSDRRTSLPYVRLYVFGTHFILFVNAHLFLPQMDLRTNSARRGWNRDLTPSQPKWRRPCKPASATCSAAPQLR